MALLQTTFASLMFRFFCHCFLMLALAGTAHRANAQSSNIANAYGLQLDATAWALTQAKTDSVLLRHPQLLNPLSNNSSGSVMTFKNKSFELYFLLGLVLFLGLIRMMDVRFFERLQNELLQHSRRRSTHAELSTLYSLNHTLLNVFACLSIGTFIWLASVRLPVSPLANDGRALLLLCILGIMAIYFVKFIFLSLAGWVFGVQKLFAQYSYEVLFINKIIGVLLLPVSCVMAFATQAWVIPLFIVGAAIILIMITWRYLRSWYAVVPYVQLSKFHFFTYICAAEILPVLLLLKLLRNGFDL